MALTIYILVRGRYIVILATLAVLQCFLVAKPYHFIMLLEISSCPFLSSVVHISR